MPLRLYNTLTQQTAEFAPQRDNTVRMYTCGPTVYDYAHIGNFRTFTFVDILRRWLRASGFRLDHVMNITDVDDKIIRNAVASNQSLEDYTAHYKQAFRDDCALLRLETPEHVTPATEHIHEMAEAIARLAEGGHTSQATAPSTSALRLFRNTASCRTTISAASAPARASTWTSTKRPTRATSLCGKRPRKAKFSGTRKSAPAGPAGTSNAP